MNSRPLVSSIIIFLNEERFIEEAIESVFAQTYDNWELLLVDDGSTDGSTHTALRYAQRYPGKVRYLEHPGHQNRGKSASRNLGLSHAKGEYVGFLDADDVWLPHALQQQVQILNSHSEAGMVYGSTWYWYSGMGNPEYSQHDFRDFVEERGVEPDTLIEPPTLLTVLLRDGGAAPCICSVLTRREVAIYVGGFEEHFRALYEDQAFFIKMMLQAPVFVASGCWSKYRQHADSSWYIAQKTGQQHVARLVFLNWLEEYLSEQGLEENEVQKLLQEKKLIAKVQAHAHKREWKQAVGSLLFLFRHHPRVFASWKQVVKDLLTFLRPYPRVLIGACRRLVSRLVRTRRQPRTPPSS